jgi:hypothetical protein
MSGALKLSWSVRTRAELQLRTYCDRRVPRHAVRQVRMEFAIRGLSAMIVERGVPWRPTSPAEEWTRLHMRMFLEYCPVGCTEIFTYRARQVVDRPSLAQSGCRGGLLGGCWAVTEEGDA